MSTWKLVLAWGCLILFFGIPLTFLILHLYHLQTPETFSEHVKEFSYLGNYLRTITAIIISLAGFSTIELLKK